MGCWPCKPKKSKRRKFTKTELDNLHHLFESATNGKIAGCNVADLQALWNEYVGKELFALLSQSYFQKKTFIDFNDFIIPVFCILKGTMEEKIHQIINLINPKGIFPTHLQMIKYVQCILSTYILIHDKFKIEEYFSWKLKCKPFSEKQELQYAAWICEDLKKSEKLTTIDELVNWLLKSHDFSIIQMSVFEQLYGVAAITVRSDSEVKFETIIPFCLDDNHLSKEVSVLNVVSVLFLNSCILNVRKEYWRLIYSNVIHGESFPLLCQEIKMQGSTLIVVKDRDEHVFGAFASESWKLEKPQFYGNASSFLYTIAPEMNIYRSSGANSNYQYMAFRRRDCPTGLGMGGQLGNFGLWISEDIMTGHSSGLCSTYSDSPSLSGSRDFTAVRLEVWGFGPTEPIRRHSSVSDRARKGSSILELGSKEFDAASVFGITGRTYHSENFPESKKYIQ